MSSKSYSLRVADIMATQFLQKSKYHASKFVVTKGGFIACSMCCYSFRERFALLGAWNIVDGGTNNDVKNAFCSVCKIKIPPAKPVKIFAADKSLT
jgi:hypothetical protein